MARLKSSLGNARIVRSMDEADNVMCEIVALRRQIALAKLSASEEVDQIKERLKAEVEGLEEKVLELKNSIELYCEYNKNELFSKKKSVQLLFGSFGYRQSTEAKPLPKWTWDRVLQCLKGYPLPDCIRVKEEVNKEALRGLEPDTLASVGVRLVSRDSFFCEVEDQPVGEKTEGAA